jgi:hypothetical protein
MTSKMKLWCFGAAVSVALFCARPMSGADPTVKVTPLSARPGDTFNLVVTVDGCPPANAAAKFDASSVVFPGSDITLSKGTFNDCSASYSAVVAAKPMNREIPFPVLSQGKTLGNFTFRIVDIPPGPIPPGLNPQVDVLWDVMSESTCSDQFGVRLARYYYCIDVMLGNNSGYPLIIASVGFLRKDGIAEYRESTSSYLSTRAMVQREQVISGRNITLRVLQGAGVIIAGFVPFSGNAGRRGRIGIWSTLVGGTLATVWDGLVPDRTVRQAGNLDDAALRDGKLIPNNSPVRFTIFVEREAIKPILLRTPAQLQADLLNAKSMAASLKEREPGKAKEWEQVAKELQEEAGQRNESTSKLKGKGANRLLGRRKAPLEDDLLSVRRALGSLIIVGDQIEYLQRVQVDASAVVPGLQPPQVQTSDGTAVPNGSVDIVLHGQSLAKATVTALKCTPTFTPAPDTSGTSFTLKAFTLTDCSETAIPLVIDNGAGAVVYNLPVAQKAVLDNPTAPVTISATKVVLNLSGKFLTGATVQSVVLTFTDSTTVTLAAAAIQTSGATPTGLKVTLTLPAPYDTGCTAAAIVKCKAAVTVQTGGGGTSGAASFTLQK